MAIFYTLQDGQHTYFFSFQAVATIGRDSRTFGFMLHNLQGWIMHAIPESFLVSQVLKLHKAIRSKAMKRKEQKKEQ